MDISENMLVSRIDTILATELDSEFVMMDIESGSYYSLSKVSADIWELLETPQKVGDIEAMLLDKYDIDAATCKADVAEFLADMANSKIVTVE